MQYSSYNRNVRVDGAQAIERGKIELVRTDFYRVYRGMSETGWEERERETFTVQERQKTIV